MTQVNDTLTVLQTRWDSTCRVLFGEEVGPLEEFKPWLLRTIEPVMRHPSSLTGKEITYAVTRYAPNSRWIGFDEIDFSKKAAPLSINQIKDLDSLVSAMSERAEYAGNAVLGNSGNVERSSNITDSFYMLECTKLTDCEYNACSTLGRLGKECFGVNGVGESQACVKCNETFRDKRCFELWVGQRCSDCYYSHNLQSCQDAMFCFNAQSLRQAIGNLPLERDKYMALKTKLIAEMADGLKRKKELPSLVEMLNACPAPKIELPAQHATAASATDKTEIERAFSDTCRVVLGKSLAGKLDDYGPWLKSELPASETLRSALSGAPVHRWDYNCYFMLPSDRLLTEDEARAWGEKHKVQENELVGITLANAGGRLGAIALFTSEYKDGTNTGLIECATSSESMGCYRSSPIVYAKLCAYSFWPRSTEHAFGGNALLSSSFCIRCSNSVNLTRCFEVDFSRDCSDCLFSHNIENCQECMFCFNVKAKRYAIGNVDVGRETYLRIKKIVLDEICARLEKDRKLHLSVFNIGAKGA